MRDKLEKRVRRHMRKKKAFLIIGVCYLGVSLILLFISMQVDPWDRVWVNFPSLIFLVVLAIIYVSMFGLRPMNDALYDEEDEIDEAVARLYEYKTRNQTIREDISEEVRLELIELQELKEKIFRD